MQKNDEENESWDRYVREHRPYRPPMNWFQIFWFYRIWWPIVCLFTGHRWKESFWNEDEVFCATCSKVMKSIGRVAWNASKEQEHPWMIDSEKK